MSVRVRAPDVATVGRRVDDDDDERDQQMSIPSGD
jgi:hypothetical protein